ncbi:MAG: hypothetical protein N4A43_04140 [Alphaproteobacteria bacterium]|jgi:hypothetical protein|nr:hypothetical protein [Alphaproteobacteria bacterium]
MRDENKTNKNEKTMTFEERKKRNLKIYPEIKALRKKLDKEVKSRISDNAFVCL